MTRTLKSVDARTAARLKDEGALMVDVRESGEYASAAHPGLGERRPQPAGIDRAAARPPSSRSSSSARAAAAPMFTPRAWRRKPRRRSKRMCSRAASAPGAGRDCRSNREKTRTAPLRAFSPASFQDSGTVIVEPSLLQAVLAVASGSAVGFSLGLVGGGGSILAVPLLFYVVGVGSPHEAIGTGAVAVAASAALGLFGHARARTIKWPCALAFAVAGVAGAARGAAVGKAHGRRQAAGAVRRAHGRRRPDDAEAAARRLRPGRASRRESAPQLLPLLAGARAARRLRLRLLRHRRRIPDRPRPCRGDRHADRQRDWLIAGVGHRLRRRPRRRAMPFRASSTGGSPACSSSAASPAACSARGLRIGWRRARASCRCVFAAIVIAAGLYVGGKGFAGWVAPSPAVAGFVGSAKAGAGHPA